MVQLVIGKRADKIQPGGGREGSHRCTQMNTDQKDQKRETSVCDGAAPLGGGREKNHRCTQMNPARHSRNQIVFTTEFFMRPSASHRDNEK
jgi:hypothetical protein